MKTLPGLRVVLVAAICLTTVGTILLFAETPTPTPAPQDLHYHLKLRCAKASANDYQNALANWKKRPNYRHDDYKIRREARDPSPKEGEYPEPDDPPCPDRPNSNVTQHLASDNMKDLVDFLIDLKASP